MEVFLWSETESGVITKGCLPSVGVSALLQQMKMDAACFAFSALFLFIVPSFLST